MELPAPRTGLGIRLRGVATSAIDVSDGLTGDLGHLLRRSGVGAVVDIDALPRSAVLAAQPIELQRECLLAGGDDYELVFTALPSRRDAVAAAAINAGVAVTRIGRIEAGARLRLIDRGGEDVVSEFGSFDHFRV
jgi:thiamine-monophosphate kinase